MPALTRSQKKKDNFPVVKGYKLMGKNMRGFKRFQYRVGGKYTIPHGGKPIMCEQGFHFCEEAVDCLKYVGHLHSQRPFRLFEVEAQCVEKEGDKSVAQTIEIKKEIMDLSELDGGIVHTNGDAVTYKNFVAHSENDKSYMKTENNIGTSMASQSV